jgi:hypothetical protein
MATERMTESEEMREFWGFAAAQYIKDRQQEDANRCWAKLVGLYGEIERQMDPLDSQGVSIQP